MQLLECKTASWLSLCAVPWSGKSADEVFTGCDSTKYQENGLTGLFIAFYPIKRTLMASKVQLRAERYGE